MGFTSLINGHIDEPENGVYCEHCIHSIFNGRSGRCKIGHMDTIFFNSYCNRGTQKERKSFSVPTIKIVQNG